MLDISKGRSCRCSYWLACWFRFRPKKNLIQNGFRSSSLSGQTSEVLWKPAVTVFWELPMQIAFIIRCDPGLFAYLLGPKPTRSCQDSLNILEQLAWAKVHLSVMMPWPVSSELYIPQYVYDMQHASHVLRKYSPWWRFPTLEPLDPDTRSAKKREMTMDLFSVGAGCTGLSFGLKLTVGGTSGAAFAATSAASATAGATAAATANTATACLLPACTVAALTLAAWKLLDAFDAF